MTDEQIRALVASGVELLTPLANQLGITAAHVYEVLVFQARVQAITQLVVWTVVIILATILCLLLCRSLWQLHFTNCAERDKDRSRLDSCEGGWELTIGVFGVFLICMAAFIIGIVAENTVPRIINPEYYAIKEILQVIARR